MSVAIPTGADPPPFLPRHQLGYVLPVNVGDYIHYQFYRVAPPDCFLVCVAIGLEAFTSDGTEAALARFWPAVEFLQARGVDRISQGGIPVSAQIGRARTLALLDGMARRTSIPSDADFEEAIAAMRTLGIRRPVVAAKWDESLMRQVADYLREAGLPPVGHANQAHTAREVLSLGPEAGAAMALALGRAAFAAHPEADGLLLAGGAWLSLAAVPQLEAEFGRPVVTNPTATYWAALRQFGRAAVPGTGRLLESLEDVA